MDTYDLGRSLLWALAGLLVARLALDPFRAGAAGARAVQL